MNRQKYWLAKEFLLKKVIVVTDFPNNAALSLAHKPKMHLCEVFFLTYDISLETSSGH